MATNHSPAPVCRKCHVLMVRGVAIENTLVSGMVDFPGDQRGVTVHPGGTGRLVMAMKCPKCGHSISAGA